MLTKKGVLALFIIFFSAAFFIVTEINQFRFEFEAHKKIRYEENKKTLQNLSEHHKHNVNILSITLANDPIVKQAYIENNPEILKNHILPMWEKLKNEKLVYEIHFFKPPAISFVNFSNFKSIGKDVSDVRKDIKWVTSSFKPSTHTLMCKTYAGFRATQPIISNSGEMLGGLSMGKKIDWLPEVLKEQTGDDTFLVYTKSSTKSLAEKYYKSFMQNKELFGEYILADKTFSISAKDIKDLDLSSEITEAFIGDKKYIINRYPIKDFNQEIMGYIYTLNDFKNFYDDFKTKVIQNMMIVFVTALIIYLIVFSQLTRITAQSKYLSRLTQNIKHRKFTEASIIEKSDVLFGKNDILNYVRQDIIDMGKTIKQKYLKLENDFLEDIKDKEQELKDYISSSSDFVWEVDEDGHYTKVSDGAYNILGYTQNEMIGNSPFDFMSKEEAKRVHDELIDIIEKRKPIVEFKNWIMGKDGQYFCMNTNGVPFYNKEGKFSGYRGADRNITELNTMQEQLDKHINYDILTDLPNKTLFEDRLKNAILRAKREQNKIAVVLINLDNFKELNDSFGHQAGDIAIKEFSQWLSESIREEDTIARFSGDAFAIMLDDIDDNLAPLRLLEELKTKTASSYISIIDHQLHITFSSGIAIYPDDGNNGSILIKNADAAMYSAKDAGKNTYRYYKNEMTELAFERVIMQSNLRNALKHNEFRLFYQPQYDVRDHKLIGMEALIRWEHNTMGILPPAKFIHILESSDLIIDVGKWILYTAFKQTVDWQKNGLNPGVVSVNLAIAQLKMGDELVDYITELLKNLNCKAEWIGLEVTESSAMESNKTVIKTIQKLSDLGFTISIDDFGTGYSSLSYLSKLSLDKLKIDKSFVDKILEKGSDATLTKAIIAMGQNLKLEVIAEGVEYEEQKDFLLINGCYEIQGYLYAKPMSVDEITTLLGFHT